MWAWIFWIVVLLIAVRATWAVAHRTLAARVDRLAAAADRVAAGDVDARADLRRGGLGRLGRALDLLAAAYTERAREAALLDVAWDGLALVDGEGRVARVNAAGARLLGATAAEVQGQSLDDLVRQRGLDLEREARPIVEGGRTVGTAVAFRIRGR